MINFFYYIFGLTCQFFIETEYEGDFLLSEAAAKEAEQYDRNVFGSQEVDKIVRMECCGSSFDAIAYDSITKFCCEINGKIFVSASASCGQ